MQEDSKKKTRGVVGANVKNAGGNPQTVAEKIKFRKNFEEIALLSLDETASE